MAIRRERPADMSAGRRSSPHILHAAAIGLSRRATDDAHLPFSLR